MTICKGVVKNNTVFLEQGAQLPDGAQVEVRLLDKSATEVDPFTRVLNNPIRYYVGIDEIIEEEKREREERPDSWLR
jgi:hypothetical protein